MGRGTLIRRGFHLTSPFWLVWYWMPPDSWVGVPKLYALLFFFAAALLIEAARLLTGRRIPGLREYESTRMSAYAWGSIGLALGLIFFPGELVIPTFWGMAWIDPLCAYSRKKGGYPWVPLVAYVLLFLAVSLLVVPTAPYATTPLGLPRLAAYAPLAAVLALAAERPNLRFVDDDFLMHVVPLLALAGISLLT